MPVYLLDEPAGRRGPAGAAGAAGPTGPTGTPGTIGVDGATGPTGPTGPTGQPGTIGVNGATGPTGMPGSNGVTGPTGSPGTAGANGVTGATGPTGQPGSNGVTGPTGPQAATASLNYVQSSSGVVTVNNGTSTTPPVTIASLSITTRGSPVQVLCGTDFNPEASGAWVRLQLYRDSTAIGQVIQAEPGPIAGANANIPFTLNFIDTPSAGTYIYSCKLIMVAYGGGNIRFGEAGGPIMTAVELASAIGPTGSPGVAGVTGMTGPSGSNGTAGITGPTGPTGPSGQGIINQTIIVNNATASSRTGVAVPEWSASYTGTGGQLLVTADITAFTSATNVGANWYLLKNGATVATGFFYFNLANQHLTLPTLSYKDTTGSTAPATWSITLGSGLNVDTSDRGSITVTEYTGITSISAASVTASGNISGQYLISTNATGNEGGEIYLTKPPTSTLAGSYIVIDSYVDRLRIFESGGSNRGAYIDLSSAPASVGYLLNNRVSGFVNAGTFVTMDNIRATVTTSGNRGLSLATVTGSFIYNIGGTYSLAGGGAGGNSLNTQTLTTTATSSIFNWGFGTEGDTSTYIINNKSSNIVYRITLMIGAAYNNNFISIERLTY